MREVIGDIWHYHNQDSRSYIVIPTDGFVKSNGCNVMGRGLARDAAKRFPSLPKMLGGHLDLNGNHVAEWPSIKLYTFPVKDVWYNKADVDLICRSVGEILDIVPPERKVYIPRVGCGNGGLDWTEVQHILGGNLDGRFTVVTRKGDI